jgi:NitT/TauT family transport system substrate-binding protein
MSNSIKLYYKTLGVTSLGIASGMVPYTAYSAKKSYIEKHPEIIQKFTNAIQKGLIYVNSHTPEQIAKVIKPQFPETKMDLLITIVKRYYDQQTWKDNAIFKEDSFKLLQNILEEAGELSKRASYTDLVNTKFATKAYEMEK